MPIGQFVADFVCRSGKLVLEIDGGQHDANSARDAARTIVLNSFGYHVIRFWNNDVLNNLDGVLLTILKELGVDPAAAPSPRDSVERAGGEGCVTKESKLC